MSISGILLGLINIAIVIAVLIVVGLVIKWIVGILGFPLPPSLDRIYMVIVLLIALYMIVALLMGAPMRFGPVHL